MKLLLSTLLLLLITHSFSAKNGFEDGCSHYENGDYISALSEFEAIIENGDQSFELFFNAGNSAHKLNMNGKAILYYEKAKKFDSNDEDLLHNLELVNKLIIDKNGNANDSSATQKIVSALGRSPNYWSWATILLVFIGFTALSLFVVSKTKRNKQLGFYLGIVTLIFGVITLFLAKTSQSNLTTSSAAIVLSPSVILKLEPAESATDSFILHEGSKVQIKQTKTENGIETWCEVTFMEGQVGWIRIDELGKI